MKTHPQIGRYALAAALCALATPAAAQVAHTGTNSLMVAPPTPDADALGEQMRIIGTDPKNADALTKAGELTLKLGDPAAAAVLLSRAEAVRPHDGRIKGDEAAVLVHMERPGEALRLFQQAEAMGADMTGFAAERGLAYDLIGQQDRAQRDYRTALAADP
ncbi:MAG: tetratricopeptide repeat protein, partial [Sphingomonas sp.]